MRDEILVASVITASMALSDQIRAEGHVVGNGERHQAQPRSV